MKKTNEIIYTKLGNDYIAIRDDIIIIIISWTLQASSLAA